MSLKRIWGRVGRLLSVDIWSSMGLRSFIVLFFGWFFKVSEVLR